MVREICLGAVAELWTITVVRMQVCLICAGI